MLHPHRITLTLICLLALQCCQEEVTSGAKVTFGEEELVIPLMQGGTIAYRVLNVGNWYGEEVLGYYNQYESCIELYGIENQDSVARIPIEQEGPNAIGAVSELFFINNLLYANVNSTFYAINDEGEVVDQSDWMRFSDDSSEAVKAYRLWYALFNNNQSAHQPQDSFLYLNFIRKDKPMDDPDYYLDNPHAIVKYNTSTHLFDPLPVQYPEQIVENIHTIWVTGLGSPQVDVHGDTVVYNFRYHDEVYRLVDGKVQVVTIPSTFFPESDPTVLNAMEQMEAFNTASGFYPIQYDPYRNLYVRYQSQYNTIANGGQLSLSLINMDLVLVAEVELPVELGYAFFFRPEAIYVAVLDKYLPDENHLRFRPIYVERE